MNVSSRTSSRWPEVTLGRLAMEVTKGESIQWQGESYQSSGIPFVRTVNVRPSGLDLRDAVFVSEATHERMKRSQLQPNDLLISIAGTLGRSCLVPASCVPANINQDVALVRIRRPEVDLGFVLWALKSPLVSHQVEHIGRGAGRIHLNLQQVQSLSFPLPPLPEQRRIAAILDKADAIRRKRQEALEAMDELLRSTFLEMFGDPVTNPRKWPVATLGEAAPESGAIVDGPFGSSLKPDKYVPAGIRVVRNFNIQDDRFDESEFKYVTLEKFREIARSAVEPGDILMSTKGTIGRVCRMPSCAGPSVLSASGTVRVRLQPSAGLLPDLAVAQMISASYKAYIRTLEAGTNQRYLNLAAIRRFRLILPPLELQRQYQALRERTRACSARFAGAGEAAQSLFESLVQRAFQGGL